MDYRLERTLPFGDLINAIAFSPDGAHLAVATRDKAANNHIFQLRDWSPRRAPRSQRRTLAFDGAGALYAAGVSVERFDLASPRPDKATLKIPGHKRGITDVVVSPDGRWVAVHKYLETLEVWYVGGGDPTQLGSFSAISIKQYFFRADSAVFCFTDSRYRAGRSVDTLHQLPLLDGAVSPLVDGPLPEGLSTYDPVFSSPLGLAAITFGEHDLTLYDWDSLTPRRLGVEAVQRSVMRASLALSPDGAFALIEPVTDPRRPWGLLVVSLATGEVTARVNLGDTSAGLMALAPGGARVAFVPSDGTREVRVFAP
ncbi:MAG: WD40 repeat domain-containing protein [Polyangiales bacterium]